MTDHTAAARQRRSRAHRSGNHTLCLPERCKHAAGQGDDVGEPAKDFAPPPTPPTLSPADGIADDIVGPRGRRLWADMSALVNLGPAHRVLLHEACRIADRLDRLDRMLENRDDWIQTHVIDLGDARHVRVTVDGMLAETRQQATVLRSIVGELRQAAATTKAAAPPAAAAAAPGAPPTKGLGKVGDLTARIAAARSRPAGV